MSILGFTKLINLHRSFFGIRFALPTITQCAGLKTVEEKLGLPAKPRKPLTPYFRFLSKVRPSLKQSNPDAAVTEIARLGALKWESVEPKLKAQLEQEYKKDHVVYLKSKDEYEKKLTGDQKEDIKQYRLDQAEAKEKREIKKRMKDLGRPKKPLSSFLRFMIDEQPRSKGNLQFREWQLKAAKMWADVNPADKKVLQDKCATDMGLYRKDLSAWEEKMVSLGHVDLVRNESLIESAPSKPRKSVSTSKPKSSE